jgi:hypothetical protein
MPPDQVLPLNVAFDFNQDVEIDRVNPDGSTTPYLGGADGSPVIDTLVTGTAADGTPQTQLVVSLPDGSPTPGPGTYQIAIEPFTNLGAVFASIPQGSAWADATAPIPIAQFTVLGHGPTLAGASDLGVIGPRAQDVWGSLDRTKAQSAVALYRFTLPQGQTWQLDAAVLAHAIGSPLLPALALIDSSGRVLATCNAGAGSSADPLDPQLVAGLEGGTYYLGVSAAGNLPGTAQGYDPVSGRPGTGLVIGAAGLFELALSATPVAPPTQLVDFKLEYADSLEPSPTGLDLTFSGPVDVGPLMVPDQQETALTVVDAEGRAWPITALYYQVAQHRLSLLFCEALPPGAYSLVSPSPGGLTDLIGRPVVGPSGDRPGVLASWTVAAAAGPSDPQDLDVVWPGPVNPTWGPAISRATTLGAGQQADYRFVVICPGVYALQTQTGSGSIDVQIESSAGATLVDTGSLTQLSFSYVYLDPGVYDLRMIAEGSQPVTVQWTFKPLALDYEKIIDNGVGQSPAVEQPMFGPFPGGSGASSDTGSTGGSTASVISTSAASVISPSPGSATTDLASNAPVSAPPGPGPSPFAASPIPAALLVTVESGPAGLPAPNAGHTAVVGPMADGASFALADSGRGLPPGIGSGSAPSGPDPRGGEGDPMAGPDATAPGPLARVGPARPAGAAVLEAASARADAIALTRAQADPLVQITGWLAGRLVRPSSEPREPDLPAAEIGTTLLASAAPADDLAAPRDPAAAGPDRGPTRDTLVHADLGAPGALLVATALTYRLSDPVRKWWRRYHTAHARCPRPYGLARGAARPAGGS